MVPRRRVHRHDVGGQIILPHQFELTFGVAITDNLNGVVGVCHKDTVLAVQHEVGSSRRVAIRKERIIRIPRRQGVGGEFLERLGVNEQ